MRSSAMCEAGGGQRTRRRREVGEKTAGDEEDRDKDGLDDGEAEEEEGEKTAHSSEEGDLVGTA